MGRVGGCVRMCIVRVRVSGESRKEEGVKERVGRLVEDGWGGWEGVYVCL